LIGLTQTPDRVHLPREPQTSHLRPGAIPVSSGQMVEIDGFDVLLNETLYLYTLERARYGRHSLSLDLAKIVRGHPLKPWKKFPARFVDGKG
jgi:hypothetical protein